jgi:hypothetical protein
MKICSVEGCGKKSNARGLCQTHYSRWRIQGHTGPSHRTHGSLEDRFWRKVRKSEGGCWEWTGSSTTAGYGTIRIGAAGAGSVLAHRFSFELHHGPIDPLHFVIHSCDNPRCVNPEHLRQGTPRDNMLDMMEKGRKVVPVGAEHFSAKLDPAKVRQVRASKESNAALARKYGVNASAISNIRHGITWKHIK